MITRRSRNEYTKRTYKYVIEEILGEQMGGNIDKALARDGYNDIAQVVKIRDSDIDELMHEVSSSPNNHLVDLNRGSKNLLRCLKAFYICKLNDEEPINDTWCDISKETFRDFRLNECDRNQMYRRTAAVTQKPRPRPSVVKTSHSGRIKGFRAIVGQILGNRGSHFSPTKVLTLQYTDLNGPQCNVAPLYDQSKAVNGFKTWRNPLKVLQSFIRKQDSTIDDKWSNVDLSDFNKFLESKIFCPLGGVVTDQILAGVSIYHMLKASVKIQSMFRQFKACHERKSLIHAGTKIQKCLRGCYMHRRWKRLTQSAFNRRWRMIVNSVVKMQSYVRGFHVRNDIKESVDVALKVQNFYSTLSSRRIERKAIMEERFVQDNIDACWIKFTGSFIEGSLRETGGSCSWIIYPDEVEQPMNIGRNLCQEMDVEYSNDLRLQENDVDGLYSNRKTMLGGPYIITAKTSEEHDATLLLLLIKYYYSLPPPYEFVLVKDKVPPDKAEEGMIIDTEIRYPNVGLKLYDGVVVSGGDLRTSNLEIYCYMPADHGEDVQLQLFFTILLQILYSIGSVNGSYVDWTCSVFEVKMSYLDVGLCLLPDIKSSSTSNNVRTTGSRDMRDELRRPMCGEILEYVDDMKANRFEEKIMYDTALLTQSHVFDDDSLTSSFDKTSEDFTVPTRAIDGNNRGVINSTLYLGPGNCGNVSIHRIYEPNDEIRISRSHIHMNNICKMFETIYNYEEQFSYLTHIEELILSDGRKDFIMKGGLNVFLPQRGRNNKAQDIWDIVHTYENFIISAEARHEDDDSGCKCNVGIRKSFLQYADIINHKSVFEDFYDDKPTNSDDKSLNQRTTMPQMKTTITGITLSRDYQELVYTTNCSYSSWQSRRFYELFARVLWGDWLHLFERYTRSTNAEMTRTLNYHYISTLFYCKRCCADIESNYSRVLYKLVDTFTLDNLRSIWKEITINLMGISQYITIVMMKSIMDLYVQERIDHNECTWIIWL